MMRSIMTRSAQQKLASEQRPQTRQQASKAPVALKQSLRNSVAGSKPTPAARLTKVIKKLPMRKDIKNLPVKQQVQVAKAMARRSARL